jgi:hypothetical protein
VRPGRALAVALLGGVVGTALDWFCHLHFGVIQYPAPEPGLFGQPWWVGPNFAVAILGAVVLSIPFARATRSIVRETWISPVATGSLWMAGAYLATGLFAAHKVPLTGALAALYFARMAFPRERKILLAAGLILAIVGPAYEAVLIRAGLFSYTDPDWIVPMWLPALYLHGAPLAIAITRGLASDRNKA